MGKGFILPAPKPASNRPHSAFWASFGCFSPRRQGRCVNKSEKALDKTLHGADLKTSSLISIPLSESLPNLHGVGGGLLFLKQQMEFIDVVAGAYALGTVGGYAAPNLILDDEHAQLLQLLAQFLDVKANQAVLDIHVGPVVKDIEGPLT